MKPSQGIDKIINSLNVLGWTDIQHEHENNIGDLEAGGGAYVVLIFSANLRL